jgi:hypothetical protein
MTGIPWSNDQSRQSILDGDPLVPIIGWMALSQYSECIQFGPRAETIARRHVEDYGGRMLKVILQEAA